MSKIFKYPEPLQGGAYKLSLIRPFRWYVMQALEKGKLPVQMYAHRIFPYVVDKTFENDYNERRLDVFLNRDCFFGEEADNIVKEMEYKILAEVLPFFPKLGSHLPKEMYELTKQLELIIHVPEHYEQQRGIFF